ncbi:alpha/beta hydrolase family protein [Arthrospira platensis]|jgi:dienelactone hydrolase|uniref:Peptidase n=1 Tax=Limnospira platensis NIES-46 TaxID=1236695 RepID=A0A5M3T721_LIMPL|nr:S9 family peptidase [Arthrospira platensis]AMW29793.1 peptidase [Arthrospira platensis YZ]KDR54154.1 peptidase [Arthrospira platensis str. Paraca]MBD2669502.1 S9 family peptidase [Arthrospira platensis FACHB-439]MBD2710075.1 S9 family peptidase [Arthrospira platensis FACHB-835]MDF2212211.1 S9 family peptidase [Arthrospira platensis NCB002]MDT9294809.1 S9 family peptidase [Arthrospira platensis PCC 7345]MDT9310396.1 S9 family peptidase [Limnospira sp. Paracas R14]QQW27734.1 S9 family pept
MSLSVAPYGSWQSAITTDLIIKGAVGLASPAWDGDDIYWIEGRPSEGGRNVIVRLTPKGDRIDCTPAAFNTRTRVHEYGGGAYTVSEGTVYFSNFADGRIYRQAIASVAQPTEILPEPITPEGNFRYADLLIDTRRGRLICVREDHSQSGEPVNTLISLNLNNPEDIQILATGADFYASPNLSKDGSRLCWICWYHPNMPWDGTELWVAEVTEDGTLDQQKRVAGGVEESIFQPQWSPDGTLYFVSDRANWWNLYRVRDQKIEPLFPLPAEFGLPQWVFGMSTFGFISQRRLCCAYTQNGIWSLATLDPETQQLRSFDVSYTYISSVTVQNNSILMLASSATEPTALVELDLNAGEMNVLRSSTEIDLDPGYLSVPEPIEFPTENDQTAYGFFYPPQNKDYVASETEKPPLLVKSHGGPTAATSSSLNLKIQYWTSRGFAVLDVNYGGSTGYGRDYRQRLQGNWGIVDVADCVNGAKFLAAQGLVDGDRMAIAGGSAGGYTTLCALTFHDVFKAGASYYGVSDLEALATDTHKFESRYLDGLIAPYPEGRDLYIARSPIHHSDRLNCPIIFFQGLEDKVVPPNQAEKMVQVLQAKGLTVEYVTFADEQHGFRKAENIQKALEDEFQFYIRVFGIGN